MWNPGVHAIKNWQFNPNLIIKSMIRFHHSKVLIPVDFSETSLLAIKHGAFIAQLTKADLYVLHVINTPLMSQNMFVPLVTIEDQTEIQGKVAQRLALLEQEVKTEYGIGFHAIIKSGNPAKEITQTAQEIKASLVVMGTHGYSPIEEIMIGSVALKVIMRSPCPTMTMSHEASHKGYQRIVLPFDLTVNSKQKAHFAIEFAKKFNAAIYAVAMLGPDEGEYKAQMELVLHQVQVLAEDKGVPYHTDVLDHVKNRATGTVHYASQVGADLIMIMTDQDTELSGLFLGPYSQQVIHKSHVPVVAIRPEELYAAEDADLIPSTSGN